MARFWTMMVAVLAVGLVALPGFAVKAELWTHDQPKDFTEGKLDDVVVTTLGEVTLGHKTTTLYEAAEETDVVNALARAGDGKIYAATGPDGIIYRIDGQEVTEFTALENGGTVLSLLFAKDGKLLAGTGGRGRARIYQIDGTGQASVFYEPPDATYIWAMARGPEGEVYAATGIEGKLYKIAADGSQGEVLADFKPKNLLCLAIGRNGALHVGTDEDGLIYRVDPKDGQSFVMYDAAQPEISALVVDGQGNLYASTADAEAAKPGRAIADKPGGKPDRVHRPSATRPKVTVATRESGTAQTQPSEAGPSGAQSRPAGSDEAAKGKPNEKGEKTDKNDEDNKAQEAKTREPAAVSRPGRTVSRAKGKDAGNAIFRIDTDGFVTEVFREPVMILAMAEAEGTIYAATGNEGRIYAITPADDRTTMLAKLEASQVTSVIRLPEGRLIVGTANAPTLVEIADAYAQKGTLTSKPLDADQIVKWGCVEWDATIPKGTKLTLATRSGNVEDEESDAWDAWSAELDATSPQQIPSLTARFLQYRLTFETTAQDATPTCRQVQIARVEQNRAPQLMALTVASALEEAKKPGTPSKVKAAAGVSGFGSSDGPAPPAYNWVVLWKAEDPNKDPLVYDVFYREQGTTRWVRMAKDAEEPLHIWDTRTVPDGKYEVRVVAKDVKGNPPGTDLLDARISDPVLVDNTPPDVVITSLKPEGKDALAMAAALTDTASRIAGASYSVDSNDEWLPVASDDDVFDSPAETVSFMIDDLDPGEHRIALQVQDAQGNTRYVSRSATVGQ